MAKPHFITALFAVIGCLALAAPVMAASNSTGMGDKVNMRQPVEAEKGGTTYERDTSQGGKTPIHNGGPIIDDYDDRNDSRQDLIDKITEEQCSLAQSQSQSNLSHLKALKDQVEKDAKEAQDRLNAKNEDLKDLGEKLDKQFAEEKGAAVKVGIPSFKESSDELKSLKSGLTAADQQTLDQLVADIDVKIAKLDEAGQKSLSGVMNDNAINLAYNNLKQSIEGLQAFVNGLGAGVAVKDDLGEAGSAMIADLASMGTALIDISSKQQGNAQDFQKKLQDLEDEIELEAAKLAQLQKGICTAADLDQATQDLLDQIQNGQGPIPDQSPTPICHNGNTYIVPKSDVNNIFGGTAGTSTNAKYISGSDGELYKYTKQSDGSYYEEQLQPYAHGCPGGQSNSLGGGQTPAGNNGGSQQTPGSSSSGGQTPSPGSPTAGEGSLGSSGFRSTATPDTVDGKAVHDASQDPCQGDQCNCKSESTYVGKSHYGTKSGQYVPKEDCAKATQDKESILFDAKAQIRLREDYKPMAYHDVKTCSIGVGVSLNDNQGSDAACAAKYKSWGEAKICNEFGLTARERLGASIEQMEKLQINDRNFLIALTQVNYQLGMGWSSKFKGVWSALQEGRWPDAINEVANSTWYCQTPERAVEFQRAIYALAKCRDPGKFGAGKQYSDCNAANSFKPTASGFCKGRNIPGSKRNYDDFRCSYEGGTTAGKTTVDISKEHLNNQ